MIKGFQLLKYLSILLLLLSVITLLESVPDSIFLSSELVVGLKPALAILLIINAFLLYLGYLTEKRFYRQKQAIRKEEQKLKDTKAKFQAIFNQTYTFIVLIECSGIMSEVNKITLEVSGQKLEDLVGNFFWEAPWWRNDQGTRDKLIEAIARAKNGDFVRFEEDSVLPDRVLKIDLSLKPLYDEENQVKWVLAEGRDITEEKRLANQLKESETLLRESQKIAAIGSYDIDLITHEVKGTQEHLKIHGLKENQLTTLEAVNNKIHPEDFPRVDSEFKKAIAEKKDLDIQFRVIAEEGREKHVWSRGHIFYDEHDTPVRVLGTIQDITERVKALEEIKNTREFVFLAEFVPLLVWTAKPDGSIDYMNRRCFHYLGLPLDKSPDQGWINAIYPRQSESTVKTWNESLRNGTPYEKEFCLKRHDGVYRWFLTRAVPMKDRDGKIVKWIGSSTDIQDQKVKNQELKEANRQLNRINKDLDNFVYTASHDLKAPISNLEALLQALKEDLDERLSPDDAKLFELIHASMLRLSGTIRDLAEISKVQKEEEFEVENVCFEDVFEDTKITINTLIESSGAQISVNFSVGCIRFSRKHLRSIFYNLLSNAIKYREYSRKLVISVSTHRSEDYILLIFEDNGLGIDMKKAEKVFGMFRRLHSHVEGSGIGLYIVKRIVENTGGKIELESEVGKGSVFKLYLKEEPYSS